MKIDGKEIASQILESLKPKVQSLATKGKIPTIAIILIGDDESSKSYIKQKELKAQEIGASIKHFNFNTTSQDNLISLIEKLNQDDSIHGIIVQRPLPKDFDKQLISNSIENAKDVDGFKNESSFDAPVAEAVIEILKSIDQTDLTGRKIVVIGRGETAGGPIIKLLNKLKYNPQVIAHETQNLEELIKKADIIISAVGKEGIFDPNFLNQTQTLIGVGLYMGVDGKLHGDYKDEEIDGRVEYYTPRLGGVGPVNVACLLKNLVTAASHSA